MYINFCLLRSLCITLASVLLKTILFSVSFFVNKERYPCKEEDHDWSDL
jgi:hypothetical protein